MTPRAHRETFGTDREETPTTLKKTNRMEIENNLENMLAEREEDAPVDKGTAKTEDGEVHRKTTNFQEDVVNDSSLDWLKILHVNLGMFSTDLSGDI